MSLPWITEWDIMLGRDLHNELLPPPPPPLPPVPVPVPMHTHYVFGTMHWALNGDAFAKGNVFIEGRKPCKHFHDIAYFIPHVPVPLAPWLLLPAIIPLSGSKIALGAFSVHFNNEPAGAWGPTLNCWSLFPRLSGTILPSRLPTVWVGVKFKDIVRSALIVGFDMLLSYVLNKAFDRWIKGPLDKFLTAALGKVVGKIIEHEVITVVNQVIAKIATEVGKKLFGKLGKAIQGYIVNKVKEWYGRTNPGMQEKYIKVFEEEAPGVFAAYLHQTWLPEIRAASFDVCSKEYPELDASCFQDPTLGPSLEELEQAIHETIGPMIKDAVRGLLSGNEWEKMLAKAADTMEAEDGASTA